MKPYNFMAADRRKCPLSEHLITWQLNKINFKTTDNMPILT